MLADTALASAAAEITQAEGGAGLTCPACGQCGIGARAEAPADPEARRNPKGALEE